MTIDSGVDRAMRDRAHFDHIAQRYASKDLYSVCRIARNARLIQSLGRQGSSYGDVMEIGCGAGFAADYLAGRYDSYTGADYSQELIDFAQSTHDTAHARFLAVDVNQFESSDRYDIVFAIGVLHHMPDPRAVVNKLKGLIRPGGYLIVNEPHPGNPLIHLLRRLRTRIDPDYSADQVELSVSQLQSIFADADFESVEIVAQGLFSTPFAEVMLKPEFLWRPIASLACRIDTLLEQCFPTALRALSWNLVVRAKKT